MLNWVAGYVFIAGAACMLLIYDGSTRSFLNAFAAFVGGAFALAMIISGVEAWLRARKERPEDWEAARARRDERARAEIDSSLILQRRLAYLVSPVGIAIVVLLTKGPISRSKDFLWHNIALTGVVFSIFVGVFVVKRCNRRIMQAEDDWRAARRVERHPELAEPRRIVAPIRAPKESRPASDRIKRTTADGSRLRRRPPGRARVHSIVEWFLLAFVVFGFPTMIYLLGPANGMFSFVAIGFTLLAITNRVDTWASEKLWTPGNAQAEDRKRQRIESGARWWAAEPPKLLRYARWVYLVLVVAGFLYCLVWPFLQGWAPEDKYPYAAVYVVGFMLGLSLLATFERHQQRLEREWLRRRDEERALD